ncbi:MAG: mannose-1-phosphate guanylyltransferase [Acidobacteriota bacterium]
MTEIYAVIMAGGRGERFWPLSTGTLPKPFIPLLGKSSLIQDTAERIRPIVPIQRTLVSIGTAHLETARKQLPQIPAENFIVEPVGRDTAACLGYSALHIEKRNPEALMLALPADHYIHDRHSFQSTVQSGVHSLGNATGVVFGITPVRPETGYGYILTEKSAAPAGFLPVVRFIEKPDMETAKQYLADGNYFWNSGMFLWKNRTLLGLFEKHMPELYGGLHRLRSCVHSDSPTSDTAEIFSRLPRISIDFGILEKTSGLRLIPSDFGWDDIGTWASLERIVPPDAEGNVCMGPHTALDSNGCILYAKTGSVAVFGVSDLIVVEANGNVLVCPKGKAPDLKTLVKALSRTSQEPGQ